MKTAIDQFFQSGEDKRNKGLYEEAIIYYEKAIAINPSHFVALNQLSYSLLQLKKYEEALYYSNKLIEISPDWETYMARAEIKQEMGDIIGAEQDRKKAWDIGKIACWG